MKHEGDADCKCRLEIGCSICKLNFRPYPA